MEPLELSTVSPFMSKKFVTSELSEKTTPSSPKNPILRYVLASAVLLSVGSAVPAGAA